MSLSMYDDGRVRNENVKDESECEYVTDIRLDFLNTCAELTVEEFDDIYGKIPTMFCTHMENQVMTMNQSYPNTSGAHVAHVAQVSKTRYDQENQERYKHDTYYILFFLRLLVIKRNGPLLKQMIHHGVSYFPPHLFLFDAHPTVSAIVKCPHFLSIFDRVARESATKFMEKSESNHS